MNTVAWFFAAATCLGYGSVAAAQQGEQRGAARLPQRWRDLGLSVTDEMKNQEVVQAALFEQYYQPASSSAAWSTLVSDLRDLADSALSDLPATAFGVGNGLYHFFFFRSTAADTRIVPEGAISVAATHAAFAIEDMELAAKLFAVSLDFKKCLDSSLGVYDFLMGMCQQKASMLFLILVELGVAAAATHDVARAANALRSASSTFTAMKSVQYHAAFADLGWHQPTDIALNDELYPRTFGPVWPTEAIPYAEFLEENYETFKADLESILEQAQLFDHLRQLERNAEGFAVWPPDSRGHIELVDSREEPPFKATCVYARRTCELLSTRPEIAQCPRAAAFFARLHPGAWLKPHLGNGRRLAAHLGLIIPDGAIELNVGPARGLRWQSGRALVWDDTHVHDARHQGASGTRYILQTFFCHPCEQQELYRDAVKPAARNVVAAEACVHKDPVRAEVSRAMRAEMNERESRAKTETHLMIAQDAPVGV